MLISVGGSVSTGSTPWIDVLSNYENIDVIRGEMRIGEAGLYKLVARLENGEVVSQEEYSKIKDDTLRFGVRVSKVLGLLLSLVTRAPGIPQELIGNIASYRLRYRGYENRLPGYSVATKQLFDKLYSFIECDTGLKSRDRELVLSSIVTEYFSALKKLRTGKGGASVLFDQLISPRLLFLEDYGPTMGKLVNDVKFIVVKRDPRDQFVDLFDKKKKNYHLMRSDKAVSTYVAEYKKRFDLMESMLIECDTSKIISVWFEDLVFDFDGALSKVEKFAELGARPSNFSLFNPSIAVKKIGMYKNNKHKSEVRVIEKAMKEHLYPMKSYS